jgi:hypothetical protein
MKFRISRDSISIIMPQYDETVLFSMSFTCLLLLISFPFSQEIQWVYPSHYDIRIIVAICIFFAGLVLSLYHAFVDRPKTSLEKTFMLTFAVIVNAFSGFMAGAYDLANSSGWLIIFPILNMANSIILFFMWRAGLLDESSISDKHAPRGQIILAAAAVLTLYYLCRVIYNFTWVQTLSVCLVYSINFMRLLETLILRPPTSGTTA